MGPVSLTPRIRKLVLATHVTASVGWLGAVVAYLAVAIAAWNRHDLALGPGMFAVLDLVVWFVIVPAACAALVTGIVQSLATEWGLFRYYWIIAKLALTVIGTTILVMHAPTVSEIAARAARGADLGHEPPHLIVHAVGGLVILVAATLLSIFKPGGKTRYGRGARPSI